MDHVLGHRCLICGAEYGAEQALYVCPKHGDRGILDVQYDYETIRKQVSPHSLARSGPRSIWRYLSLLPIDPIEVARLPVPSSRWANLS